MKNKIFLIGSIITVVVFALTTVFYFACLYIFPFIIIGYIFIWVSSKNIKTKITWTLIPLIFISPAIFTLKLISDKVEFEMAQKLDFIFLKNYVGKVVVVENIPNGQEIKKINNREQLLIPQNGILLYKGTFENKMKNHKYYYIDKNEKKIEIPSRSYYMYWSNVKNKPSNSKVGVWTEGMGSDYYIPKKISNHFEKLQFIICSKDSLKVFQEFNYQKKFDSITYKLIEQHLKKTTR